MFRKKSILTLLKIFVPAIVIFSLLALYSYLNDFKFNDLSEDPVQTLQGPKYLGLLVHINIAIMCFASAILLFASKISSASEKPAIHTRFLFFAGLFSLLLVCDDFFMFHDWVFRDIIPIEENVIFGFYALSALVFLVYFRNVILKTDYILLLAGVGFMGISVLTDIAVVNDFSWKYKAMLEDGSKFFGMVSWVAYFIKTSWDFIRTDDL